MTTRTETATLGNIECVSGEILFIDPCYPKTGGTELESSLKHDNATKVGLTPGEYVTAVEYSNEGAWGVRVAKLMIYKPQSFPVETYEQVGMAGVDSGQMMIIDPAHLSKWVDDNEVNYEDFETLYNKAVENNELSYFGACGTTGGKEKAGILSDLAAVSSTGYGDGHYPVYKMRDSKNALVGYWIDFLGSDDEEDEGW